jgi:pilus assembly protein Flp/PilA
MVKRFWTDETGADATEYALLAALIAVAIITGAQTLGDNIGSLFLGVADTIADDTPVVDG